MESRCIFLNVFFYLAIFRGTSQARCNNHRNSFIFVKIYRILAKNKYFGKKKKCNFSTFERKKSMDFRKGGRNLYEVIILSLFNAVVRWVALRRYFGPTSVVFRNPVFQNLEKGSQQQHSFYASRSGQNGQQNSRTGL